MSLQLKDHMGLVQHVVRVWRQFAQAAVESLQRQAGRAQVCCHSICNTVFHSIRFVRFLLYFMCLHHFSMIPFARQHGHGWGQHHRLGFHFTAQYIRC